jgi:hypothetical protein
LFGGSAEASVTVGGLPNIDAQGGRSALLHLINGFRASQAVHVAATLGLADLLSSDPEAAAELAVATETHPAALYRLMRALASTGVFEEDESGRFALTTVGEILRSDIAGTHAPMALLHGRPDNWQAWADLSYAVRSGATAFDHVHGSSVWEYRAKHPEESRVFDRAMAVGTERFAEIAIGVCNFGRFGTVVDIGGGDGVKPASSRRPWTSPALTPSGRCRASWTRIRWYGWRRSMDCWWTCATCRARSRRPPVREA